MAGRSWRAWKARRCLCRSRSRASGRACAWWRRSAATRRPRWRRLLLPQRSGLRLRAGTLARAAAASISTRSTEAQLAYKQAILRETLERGGVRAPEEMAVLAGEPWAYRNRIRVAFDAEGRAGYRGRRSHAVVPIAECPIAAPLLVRAALAAGEIAHEMPSRLRPSEMALFCDAAETALLASVTVAGGGKGRLDDFARALAERIPETGGVELVAAGGKGREPRNVARWGTSSLLYSAGGFEYRVDQGAFFQVNRWLVDELVDCVTGGRHGGLAWDLFAGVGLFARRLAEQFNRVVAVESAPAAMAALKHNLRGTRATAVKAATLDFLRGARNRRAAGCGRCGSAAHRPGRGDDGASGGNCGAGADLCFMRPGDAGARPARAAWHGLCDRARDSRGSFPADVSSGNGGRVTAVTGQSGKLCAGNPDS